jgi:hypothetical protein
MCEYIGARALPISDGRNLDIISPAPSYALFVPDLLLDGGKTEAILLHRFRVQPFLMEIAAWHGGSLF